MRCMRSIFTEEHRFTYQVVVVDSHSDDGSAEAVDREFGGRAEVVTLDRRTGKAEVDNLLLSRAEGEFALLLNDDSELRPGAAAELLQALRSRPQAAAAGAQLLAPDGGRQPCAWRFPGVGTALIGAVTLGRAGVVQSGGSLTREVDWCQSAALMVRCAANRQIGGLDPQFFVYSDEVDWCKRAANAGWSVLYVPAAEVVHHEQLGGSDLPANRIVEFCRNRDLYIRKHCGPVAPHLVRGLTAWQYLARAVIAMVLPSNYRARRYLLHARQTLQPTRGQGLRELAQQYNDALNAAATGGTPSRQDPARPGHQRSDIT